MTEREPQTATPGRTEQGAKDGSEAAELAGEGAQGAATVAGEDGAAEAEEARGAVDPEGGADHPADSVVDSDAASAEALEAAELGEEDGEAEEAAGAGAPEEPDPHARTQAERDEYLALAQRTQADFDNYRKRAARDIAAAGARSKASLARELLPVVDNLERALESAEEGEGGLIEGLRLVHSELVEVLQRNGVEALEPGGEPFDPNVHEALSTRSEDGAEAGVVLDVVQKGYRLEGTVLRPARVVVAA